MDRERASQILESALALTNALPLPAEPSAHQELRDLLQEANREAKADGSMLYRWCFGLVYDALRFTSIPLNEYALDGLRDVFTLLARPLEPGSVWDIRRILIRHGLDVVPQTIESQP